MIKDQFSTCIPAIFCCYTPVLLYLWVAENSDLLSLLFWNQGEVVKHQLDLPVRCLAVHPFPQQLIRHPFKPAPIWGSWQVPMPPLWATPCAQYDGTGTSPRSKSLLREHLPCFSYCCREASSCLQQWSTTGDVSFNLHLCHHIQHLSVSVGTRLAMQKQPPRKCEMRAASVLGCRSARVRYSNIFLTEGVKQFHIKLFLREELCEIFFESRTVLWKPYQDSKICQRSAAKAMCVQQKRTMWNLLQEIIQNVS